jgi:hypothetical protein
MRKRAKSKNPLRSNGTGTRKSPKTRCRTSRGRSIPASIRLKRSANIGCFSPNHFVRSLHAHCEENKARPFTWTAEWRDEVSGVLQIENIFQPGAARRWVSFETRRDS